ncbi:hypothetical protein [Bradyrhizobium sp. MOS003]|jgi:hypothetical protein|uniref:hypothetical protein n=1 Tax=Bradyrhizobium sp. MOS003 TaxID=2133946 RepID=UPI000D129C42|nr:hypothetical protein [Bradyrhizobium sp. MOS003]
MKEVNKVPERDGKAALGLRRDGDRADGHGVGIPLPSLGDQAAWKFTVAPTWPFSPNDSTPLTWWRTMPAHVLRDQERAKISETLRYVDVLRSDDEFRAALNGDADAAIATALAMMPIKTIDYHTDIAMTALLRCALAGQASAALVLAQIVGLTDVGHALTRELSVSWLGWGFRYSTEPEKFGEAGAVVLSAIKAHESGTKEG